MTAYKQIITSKEQLSDVIIERDIIANYNFGNIIPKENINSVHVLVLDAHLTHLYGKALLKKINASGFKFRVIEVESGEDLKTIENYVKLSEQILELDIDSNSFLVSFGGGTVNNIVGFIASTLYRGLGLIHIPTTLMSQCDAAIGIKQGVNTKNGKNLLGSFYEPYKIIVDPTFLLSNSLIQLKDGLVECIKHALAQDNQFYQYLLEYEGDINDINFLHNIIVKNITLKIELMNIDSKERKEALVLQYGHTFGHIIEHLSDYTIGHGFAVSIGMRIVAEIAVIGKVAEEDLVKKHIKLMKKYKLPYCIPKYIELEDIINDLKHCKRYTAGSYSFVVTKDIGLLYSDKDQYSYECDSEIIKKAILRSYQDVII